MNYGCQISRKSVTSRVAIGAPQSRWADELAAVHSTSSIDLDLCPNQRHLARQGQDGSSCPNIVRMKTVDRPRAQIGESLAACSICLAKCYPKSHGALQHPTQKLKPQRSHATRADTVPIPSPYSTLSHKIHLLSHPANHSIHFSIFRSVSTTLGPTTNFGAVHSRRWRSHVYRSLG